MQGSIPNLFVFHFEPPLRSISNFISAVGLASLDSLPSIARRTDESLASQTVLGASALSERVLNLRVEVGFVSLYHAKKAKQIPLEARYNPLEPHSLTLAAANLATRPVAAGLKQGWTSEKVWNC